MRIIIKGGVWKNTEDEILKAAVMKYGKNQWARVASLLSRKTANQCKARWYEWLDPSVKKTEWNKDEEEKLLHLAKLMPNQWRTIAPIVGRTAGQCMEHYERLLDQAQDGGTSGDQDDPRRLKQGEIDPTPESKPARPDPIDMDEDEKEMLSEARARLANTKGKKAKRKARERQLEEARRLSVLQKRRELKAAGIESKLGAGSSKYINYRKEIPFQKMAPAGFYDVSEEVREGKAQHLDAGANGLDIAVMEGRHARAEEEKEKRQEEKRLKMLFKANAPQAVAQISALNDPTALRRRAALSIPEPQVSDAELENIVKLSASSMPPPDGSRRGTTATQVLVGDYDGALLENRATPLRTPIQENVILQEARNLRILRDSNPLLDHQNEIEQPELIGGFGFEGVDPRSIRAATPNTVLATPVSSFGTERKGVRPSSKWGAGPSSVLRDQFGLNHTDAMSETASVMSSSVAGSQFSFSSKIRDKELRAIIASQLKALPEPEYSYDIAIPELEKESEDTMDLSSNKPEDAAEVIAQLEHERTLEKSREFSRRSAVIKRDLPRPGDCSLLTLKSQGIGESNLSVDINLAPASAMLNEEMIRLLARDAFTFPTNTSGAARAEAFDIPDLGDDFMEKAKAAISIEMASTQNALVEQIDSFCDVWDDIHKGLACVPVEPKSKNVFSGELKKTTLYSALSLSKEELLLASKYQFRVLRSKFEKISRKSEKSEAKLEVTQQGYITRSFKSEERIQEVLNDYRSACTDLDCYETLKKSEQKAVARRQKRAFADLEIVEAREEALQKRFKSAQEIYNSRFRL